MKEKVDHELKANQWSIQYEDFSGQFLVDHESICQQFPYG